MKTISITKFLMALIVSILLLFAVAVFPASADHEDEHDDSMTHDEMMHDESASDVATMEALIKVLQQLITLLTEQVEMGGDMHMEHDHSAMTDTLSISVEEHDGRTHIHVNEPGKDEVKFFLDDLAISEEDAIIDAIVAETGLPEDDVAVAASFPSDADDSEHEHEDDEMDIDGIHIMSDGTVMLGSGEVIDDATVTDDGMIMLADGDLVEPEFDLR